MIAGLTFDEATHVYRMNGDVVPSVTQVLAPLCNFSAVPAGVLAAASAFGTAVHKACELFDLGTLDEEALDPALTPYLAAWKQFSFDYMVTWDLVEELVYHPGMRYAGTLDRYGWVKGNQTVVDIKSSANLYPSVGPQLAGYKAAIPGASTTTERMAVQLKGDGTYVAKKYTNRTDWPVFASLVTLKRWCQEHSVSPHFES